MKIDKLVLLSVVLCIVVLAGELAAYGPNPHRFGAEAELKGDSVVVTVTSSGSDTFSAALIDNGTHPRVTRLYIFVDERYDEFFEDAKKAAALSRLDISHATDQICRSLKVRGFDDVVICNDGQLLSAMVADIGGGVPKGLLVMSYALPENIYSGSKGDLLFDWIGDGGSLYWMASPAGMFYRTGNELITVDDCQELFFGKECVNTDDAGPALSVIDAGGLTDALALKWNRTLYGLDTSGITGAMTLGFSLNGYSSISMVPSGNGMICVFGGSYDRNLCDDISQIISSGVTCYSDVVEIRSGTVTRGSVEFSFEMPDPAGRTFVYVSIGGYYTVFGRPLDVQ